jgi:hypothetical protein
VIPSLLVLDLNQARVLFTADAVWAGERPSPLELALVDLHGLGVDDPTMAPWAIPAVLGTLEELVKHVAADQHAVAVIAELQLVARRMLAAEYAGDPRQAATGVNEALQGTPRLQQ